MENPNMTDDAKDLSRQVLEGFETAGIDTGNRSGGNQEEPNVIRGHKVCFILLHVVLCDLTC